jgi:hypothetical protein
MKESRLGEPLFTFLDVAGSLGPSEDMPVFVKNGEKRDVKRVAEANPESAERGGQATRRPTAKMALRERDGRVSEVVPPRVLTVTDGERVNGYAAVAPLARSADKVREDVATHASS